MQTREGEVHHLCAERVGRVGAAAGDEELHSRARASRGSAGSRRDELSSFQGGWPVQLARPEKEIVAYTLNRAITVSTPS